MRVSEDEKERIKSMEKGREVEQGHRHLCRFLSRTILDKNFFSSFSFLFLSISLCFVYRGH